MGGFSAPDTAADAPDESFRAQDTGREDPAEGPRLEHEGVDPKTVRESTKKRFDSPAEAIADDWTWHRIIIREHHMKDAQAVLDRITERISTTTATRESYLTAVADARRSGELRFATGMLEAVIVGLAKEVLLQLALPGVILPPTDFIGALFAAAGLGEYTGRPH
jgi:hypothetical protein